MFAFSFSHFFFSETKKKKRMFRLSHFGVRNLLRAPRSEPTEQLVSNKHRIRQMRYVPGRIAISFGSMKKPIAFLPRQPIEDDKQIFPENVWADSTFIEYDTHRLKDFGLDAFNQTDENVNTPSAKPDTKQLPVALLQ